MSDHPKEAKRNLKRIFICDDTYFDIFHWLAPAKVGLALAFVSDRFDALVDTHFKYRKWTLGTLRINSNNIVKSNEDGSEETMPIPQMPLPNSIVGFSFVDIFSINSDVIAFLQCIGPLFASDVCLELHIYGEQNWNTFTTSIWPLINVSAIINLYIRYASVFNDFRRLISPSILCDCSNLRVITCIDDQSLQFPPDDSNGSTDGQAICKWLHTPRADGQPKLLRWGCWSGDKLSMDALKKTFLNATTSVSFIIRFCSVPSLGPFELVNSLTNERLICWPMDYFHDSSQLIERSPMDKCAEKWAKWKREAMKFGENGRYRVFGMYLSPEAFVPTEGDCE